MTTGNRADPKPRILLAWGYTRKGWIQAFERLNDYFEFVYVRNICQPTAEIRHTQCQVVYWGDFASPQMLLERVRPRSVIFMAINSGYAIALNIACRRRGIPTYILQHGLFPNYRYYRSQERMDRQNRSQTGKKRTLPAGRSRSRSLSFLIRGLGWSQITLFPLLACYFALQRMQGTHFACRWMPFRWRKPVLYICYTRQNATLYIEEDRASRDEILTIGVPEMDEFFSSQAAVSNGSDYYVLIDQPLAENQYVEMGITRTAMVTFYNKLNEFCLRQNCRLKVKLHPESYASGWLPQHGNIDWLRDTDVVSLIKGAQGCFGIFSTLLLPAIYLRKTCVFKSRLSFIHEDLERRGVVLALEFNSFTPEEIDFEGFHPNAAAMEEYVRDYLYAADGQATERLAQVLIAS